MELIVQDIDKIYDNKIRALQGFNFKLKSGILGLLGPNGAGKSTLLRILATIIKPTTGSITWNGINILHTPDALRANLGYLPQNFGVYPNLNAFEFLRYTAALKGLDTKQIRKRIDELLQILNLSGVDKRPLGSYSGGMKQRIGLAQALLNDPAVLILDEPTSGLDPEERVNFRNLLSNLSGQRIIILSTHIVSDIEAIATDILIIDKGHLLVHSLPEKILCEVERKVWECTVPSSELPDIKRRNIVGGISHHNNGACVRIIGEKPTGIQARLVSPTLEDSYLYFIHKEGSKN